jgi:heme A synthase
MLSKLALAPVVWAIVLGMLAMLSYAVIRNRAFPPATGVRHLCWFAGLPCGPAASHLATGGWVQQCTAVLATAPLPCAAVRAACELRGKEM